ncbi:RHS repeat-associated core domain-containing protein [Stenotrophomonas sp. HITSZ_GD]|uniref:RHS repeat domain-containing protein n=1 Tax=Stenotrophomonas sp. HITSZ_GD TaxID=3037248 RepID=UPI00240CF816|nr:RHS repeat-associated core domain-containing protein [Stenotrophomonas sp. HITSZ_GD]MDG2526213.1 RHS repeat-associated core domain-containing protein [Stenotrophomonas sp. HITSZ_GD]
MKSDRADSAWARPGWRVGRWAAPALVCLGLSVTAGRANAQTVEYIHTDALGSPVATTNASGAVIERQVYEPYGAPISHGATDGPGFTGHVEDSTTGLTYMQQRYYDAEVGRFISIDPVYTDPLQGANFNRFQYAESNPYFFTDRDGRESGATFKLLNDQANGGPVIPPPRSPDDWLGPAIGVGLGAMLVAPLPAELAAGWRVYRLYRMAQELRSPPLKSYDEVVGLLKQSGGQSKQTSASGTRTTQYPMPGGQKAAEELFDRATNGSGVPVANGGRLGKMGDGTTVHMSSRVERDGSRTTSVRFSREKVGSHIKEVTKVRYKEGQ